jgi:hypothetical protein
VILLDTDGFESLEEALFDFLGNSPSAGVLEDNGAGVGILHCEPTPHIEWSDDKS